MLTVISSSATIELVAVNVKDDPAFSAIEVADVARVTVGAVSYTHLTLPTKA